MTKDLLAVEIYETVQNASSKAEAIAGISALISTLEPENPERFAKWGTKNQKQVN